MKTISSLVFALCCVVLHAGDFTVELREDEMTGDKTMYIYTVGEAVKIDDFSSYEPAISFVIANPMVDDLGRLRYMKDDMQAVVRIQTEGMKRDLDTMSYKVGTNALVKAVMETSEDRRSAFIPRPSEFLGQLKEGGTVFFRFTTTLGKVRTLKFPNIPAGAVKTATDKWMKKNPGRLKRYAKKS